MLPMASCRRKFSSSVRASTTLRTVLASLPTSVPSSSRKRLTAGKFVTSPTGVMPHLMKIQKASAKQALLTLIDLELRNGDLWACNIDWTPEGADDLANKRYMYISQAFDTNDKGEVVSYRNFTLNYDPLPTASDPSLPPKVITKRNPPKWTRKSRRLSKPSKNSLSPSKSSHEESSKKMDEALKRHEESLKKHEKRMKKLEDEEDEDEEDEETLEPTGGGDGDGGGKDPDPDDDDDKDDEDERRENETDAEYEARKEAKLQRLTTRAGLNDEVVRLTRKLARRNGNLVTKADVKTRIMQAHKNGLLMKSQIPWALGEPQERAEADHWLQENHRRAAGNQFSRSGDYDPSRQRQQDGHQPTW